MEEFALPQTGYPSVVAYGMGVDSTAALIELQRRGITPDAILFGDTGHEKRETYAYLPIIRSWLRKVGFPDITVVRYVPKKFPCGTEYSTLGGFCLANGTLPSLAFGVKSCSLKWKVRPQQLWIKEWEPARRTWSEGGRVTMIIGYDCSPKDIRRYVASKRIRDNLYQYWYPLIDWGYDREACIAIIQNAGLPVPPKSACTFCPATKPEELLDFSLEYLRYIVVMEANARPKLLGLMDAEQLWADFSRRHLEWSQKLEKVREKDRRKVLAREPKLRKTGTGCAGLWRQATRNRPAAMTDFIVANGLLPVEEVQELAANAPQLAQELIANFEQEIMDFND